MDAEFTSSSRVIPIVDPRVAAIRRSGHGSAPARSSPGSASIHWQGRFADLYCAHVGVRTEHFIGDVYRQVLYPHACWLSVIPTILRSNAYAADYDFIAEVGEARSYADYDLSVAGFQSHPLNAGWLRQFGRLRISIGRMNRLVYTVLRAEG